MFPNNDQYWINTVDFLQTRIQDGDKILAPTEFEEKFANVITYSVTRENSGNDFQWVIIHKGMMENIEYPVLDEIIDKNIPVFANEVFVILTNHTYMSRLDNNSIHLELFWEKIKWLRGIYIKSQSGLKRDFFHNSIYFNIKDIGSLTRTELELNSRKMSQTAYLGNGVLLCRILTKYMCYVDSQDMSLTPHLCLNGYWESWITQAMVRVLERGFYCLDIGANCGYYSLIMADIVGESGQMVAVEANPRLATLVERSLVVNGFKRNSQVLQKAVSDTNGTKVNLVVPEGGYLGDATISRPADQPGDSIVEVETVTIDELTQDWPRVDLIKIDAEGAEEAIWRGMQETIKRNQDIIIIMEFCSYRNYDPKSFLEDIQLAGFVTQYIDNDSQLKSLTVEDCLTARPGEYWDLYLQRKK
ncbi:FkbM family methyltransferase [Trichormus sp. NMC-1]|uniref:FkbM family methyltransferase n=1 Tax=Trichormus sp. NMC-1 TaxID=1853259 RepID=UPI001F0095A7|nr:FkbM family methyltransferase [Trichormus sp. NMC-1]